MSDTLLTPRFHVIGTQLNAWRALSGGQASTFKSSSGTGNVAVASSSDTGAFGSSMLTMASSTQLRGLRYPGQNNWSEVGAFTVMKRIIPRWSGAPAASEQGFFHASSPWNTANTGVFAGMDTNGKPYMGIYDQYGTAYMNPNTDWATAYTSFVSGTAIDLLFLWDGTTSAAKFYAGGSLIASMTPAAGSPSVNNLNIGSIALGMCPNGGTLSNYDLNEAAIWDYALSSTDIATLSARTGFLATSAFDGTAYTVLDPSVIKIGTSCTQAGVATTGTYDGSDRWSVLDEATVEDGVNFKSNSLTDNKTGTLLSTDPGEDKTLNGTEYMINSVPKTGTLIFSGGVTILSSGAL